MSKAIDLGAHYASNASSRDAFAGRSQTELEVHGDVKSLSDFDQTHAAVARVNYRDAVGRPGRQRPEQGSRRVGALFRGSAENRHTVHHVHRLGRPPGSGTSTASWATARCCWIPRSSGRSIAHPDTSRRMLPRSAFDFVPLHMSSGNLGRNVFRKDGIQNVNLSLSRSWKIASESTLTFRAESINLFNTPQFAYPGNDLTGRQLWPDHEHPQ